jgi:4-hydroxy-3-methylbut-2-enyl diphosphate reductase
VIDRLKELGVRSVRPLEGVEENVTFPLPKGLDGISKVAPVEGGV